MPKGMKNKWKIHGETATVYLKKNNGEVWETEVDVYTLYRMFHLGVTWTAHGKDKDMFYVVGGSKGKHISLHRFIMNYPEDMEVDHINGSGQDNRMCNLRIVTSAQNQQNRSPLSKRYSGLRGVRYHKADGKWTAEMIIDGKYMYLGTFLTKDAAYQRVVEARKEYMPFSSREIS